MREFPPKFLSITCPINVGARPRGNMAHKSADPQHTIRMPPDIVASIDKAAGILGITRAEFMRWVSFSASQELIGLHDTHNKSK